MLEKVTVYSRHNKIRIAGALIVFKPTEMPGINYAEVTVEIAVKLEESPGTANRSLRALDGKPELESDPEPTGDGETATEEVAPAPRNRGGRPKKKPAGDDADAPAQSESESVVENESTETVVE